MCVRLSCQRQEACRQSRRTLHGIRYFFKKTSPSSNGIASRSTSQSTVQSTSQSISQSTSTAEPKKMTDHLLLSANSLNAEILWALKVVLSHFSFRSCAELSELFQVMFSDSEIASEFILGKTKCSYFINYGLAPYFKDTLLREINTSEFFSLSFDESLNKEIQSCQMDVGIRFWNDCTKPVETRYYDSQFLHQPNADQLFQIYY